MHRGPAGATRLFASIGICMYKRTQIFSLTESLQARPKGRRKLDFGAGVKTVVQANCLKDLFFILNLEPRLLQGGKCPRLAASELGEHSARQEKDLHTSWSASPPGETRQPLLSQMQ